MSGINKAILIGNLGRDPELRYTPSGRAVVSFPLATTDQWTGQDGQRNEKTVWHNIIAWGKQAEVMKEYLRKGRQVYIEGRIDNRSYEKKDGSGKAYISEVIVQNFQFLGGRPDNAGGRAETEAPPESEAPEGAASNDDDLPF